MDLGCAQFVSFSASPELGPDRRSKFNEVELAENVRLVRCPDINYNYEYDYRNYKDSLNLKNRLFLSSHTIITSLSYHCHWRPPPSSWEPFHQGDQPGTLSISCSATPQVLPNQTSTLPTKSERASPFERNSTITTSQASTVPA